MGDVVATECMISQQASEWTALITKLKMTAFKIFELQISSGNRFVM
jgi:hypothetical protein